MNILETRLYRWLDVLATFFFLNLLWLLACVPLITLFPATAALFAVVRDWVRGKDKGFLMPFFHYARENFVQSLVVGLAWTAVGLVLAVDFLFVRSITSWVRTPMLALLFLLVVVYGGTAVYLFPVMVHYQASWFHIIKNALIIALSSPVITLLSLFIVVVAGLAIYYIPLSFLLIGSVTAYLLYRLCHRKFQQIQSIDAS
ncbi:MAG: DUF624 domain-containing protein [Anaerolineaceae bacterium]|nr:DUF624 domain-containing protein [Anaerolineaceae bacterium]